MNISFIDKKSLRLSSNRVATLSNVCRTITTACHARASIANAFLRNLSSVNLETPNRTVVLKKIYFRRSTMCAAIDMLATEHFYGISPPASFLTSYAPPIRRLTHRGYSAPCLPIVKHIHLSLKNAPRSCLRAEAKKSEKKVVFADDRGFALEQIRFMTEPSHIPPVWALTLASPPVIQKEAYLDIWQTKFHQPASNYLEFRRKITEDCVSLENVIVKDNESALDGTVKVKNIHFCKEVLIRASYDGWRTHEDTYCAFSEAGPLGTDGVSVYDTFFFRLQLPIHSRRLNFCVCFRCVDQEFWDNNGGINYTVEKSSVKSEISSAYCARINTGNSWTSKEDSKSHTPYW